MRLDKFLAEASVGTRKIVRNDIKDGMVMVNNQLILDPATEVEENTDIIEYLSKKVIHPGKKYYMFHKPGGCITAKKDENCKTVLDYFEVDNKYGLFPVGRLDKDTEGLLFLTNDGEFNNKLMAPGMHVEKTYYFWAFGSLDFEDMESMKTGVVIGEEEPLAKAINIEVMEQGNYTELKDKLNLVNRKDININPYNQCVVSGNLTISEGRKHQVKRMLKAVGCYVVYLKRISIGGLRLDQSLKLGQYRELTEEELKMLE